VFILSFPLKTALGLVTMVAVLPLMAVFVNYTINVMETNMTVIMGLAR
jgi:flagellar biosynthesis protein FliR